MTKGRDAHDPDRVAAVVERLAALLGAGVAEATAWRLAADGCPPGSERAVAALVAAAVARDDAAAIVIEAATDADSCWRAVSATWSSAADYGAGIRDASASLAIALRDRADTLRRIRAALAGPIATTRLVGWLPVLSALGAAALGADTVAVLCSPVGLMLLTAGGLLALGCRLWTRRLVRAALPAPHVPGLRHELVAMLLRAGATPARAAELARHRLADAAGDRAEVDRVLDLADRSGAPAAALLTAEAGRRRRADAAEGVARVERLGVRLMVPLGVCLLPAFVLTGVVPMLIALLGGGVLA